MALVGFFHHTTAQVSSVIVPLSLLSCLLKLQESGGMASSHQISSKPLQGPALLSHGKLLKATEQEYTLRQVEKVRTLSPHRRKSTQLPQHAIQ